MDEIGVKDPNSLGNVYLKVYNNQIFGIIVSSIVMFIILRSFVIFYALFGACMLFLFTGGYGGLVSYPFRFNIDKGNKRVLIHYFKVPFIKKYRSYALSEIKVEYALPKNFAHNKDDKPWLLIYSKGELVFYINQHNAVGWSQEEILSIYNRLSAAIL